MNEFVEGFMSVSKAFPIEPYVLGALLGIVLASSLFTGSLYLLHKADLRVQNRRKLPPIKELT